MDDLDKIKKFKNDIDSIEVPTEIDFAIEKGLKRKEKKDKIKMLTAYFAAIAAVILIVFNIPFVKTQIQSFWLHKNTKVDSRGIATVGSYKNFKNILENYGGIISKSQSTMGISRGSTKITENGSNKDTSVQNASHSSTNVQVNGVDEPDLVKNDGKFIYTLSKKNNKIMIVNAYPTQSMKLESSISIDNNFYARNMLLKDDFLIVFGEKCNNSVNGGHVVEYWNTSEKSEIMIYDISDKETPKLVKNLIVSGRYNDSRLIGDKVYVVSNQNINIDFKNEGEKNCVPFYTDSSLRGKTKEVDYKNIVYNPKDVYPNYINISSIDLSNINSEAKITSMLGNGSNIYCNSNNMYIASQSDQNNTTIYKFQLLNGKAELKNKTEVSGSLLNQFSMDEYNGYLRMALTQNANYVGSGNTSSTVYIFDKNLKMVSKLSGIAKGERIYSARFVENRAYIVTFKQTDPLFAIDLTDPKRPKITGKLEMPGFSTYLQPYDENHIIGFGEGMRNIIENGYSVNETDGIKFAMFDITDMANPKQMYGVNFGGDASATEYNSDKTSNYDAADNITRYSSEVLHNHKALLFDKDKGIMALPIETGDSQGLKCGIYVYKVDLKNGFKLAYKLESQKNESLTCRAVYIGDTLYTIFDSKIVAVDMNSFKDIGELKF